MWRTHLLLPLVLVAGCGKPDPQDLEKRVNAWSGALQLVGDEVDAGHVPDLYVPQVLKAADKQLRTLRSDIEQLPQSEPNRPPLQWRLGEVTAQAAVLRSRTQGGGA